jgi:hypothetical protein
MSCRVAMTVATLVALALLGVCGPTARAAGYTSDDTLAAIDIAAETHGVSRAWLYRIVDCETGHTLDPSSVGRLGEIGAAQLYRYGELPRFYARGYSNPWSPYEAIDYLAQRLNEGAAHAWACA